MSNKPKQTDGHLVMELDALYECVKRLNADEQQVMMLRLSGMTKTEIASQLQQPQPYVEQTIKRAISQLRAMQTAMAESR